jgi:DNA-binding transcriptional regulator GbsR (MarR family)
MPDESGDPVHSQVDAREEEVIRAFVEHWGMMARLWGINATMGELFAVLFVTGRDWSADELRERLHISRGNVSMNLRELIGWGVVQKVHRQGVRREYFRAESDVWTIFRRIIGERKRREIGPTLKMLEDTVATLDTKPSDADMHSRAKALLRFFSLVDRLGERLTALEPDEIEDLLAWVEDVQTDDENA